MTGHSTSDHRAGAKAYASNTGKIVAPKSPLVRLLRWVGWQPLFLVVVPLVHPLFQIVVPLVHP